VRVFNLLVFSRAELTKMVCTSSLVERLDLLPIAVLLMTLGKLPARRAKSAHFVGHLPPFFLVAAFAPGMVARGKGSIINVSSMAGQIGLAGGAAYGATKAALVSMTRAWAAEFSPSGVRVNAIAVHTQVIYGDAQEVRALLREHTAYVERTHLTSRQMNGHLVPLYPMCLYLSTSLWSSTSLYISLPFNMPVIGSQPRSRNLYHITTFFT
jgi:NAD(P)-dependent dehydrogenase (short-subunit alcohol dehydrogenase family)